MRKNRICLTALAIGLGITACAGGRNSLGTGATPCFRALPPAKTAVHDKGRLIGVRRVTADTLKKRIPNDTKLAALPNQDLCVFAFEDTFDASQVTGAAGQAKGRYAVVVVTSKRPEVVRSIVTNRLPTRFAHLH